MTRLLALLLAFTLCCGVLPAMAADGNQRTCALSKVIECAPDEECTEWTPLEVGLPRFVRIDLNSKNITSLDKEVQRSTRIATVQRLDTMTILQGTELRGWSIALGEESGDLTLSAAGDGEGFIVFGSCITQ